MNKSQFLWDKRDWLDVKAERWNLVKEKYSKIIKIRPDGRGTYAGGLIRKAIVSVPPGISSQLCHDDLAAFVAGGPNYSSFSVEYNGPTVVAEITSLSDVEPLTFNVTVTMDLEHVKVRTSEKEEA